MRKVDANYSAPDTIEIVGYVGATETSEEDDLRRQFDNFDIEDRYEAAKSVLEVRRQTQNMLIAIVSAKLTEGTSSFAQQHIRLFNYFAYFDKKNTGYLNESELRDCLESANIQFDIVTFTSLFAYFDKSFSGRIEWRKFLEKIMVPNPKGGHAILPKQITTLL